MGTLIGTFNPTADGSLTAQVFTFGPVTTQFLHIDVLTMRGASPRLPGIGEVAFRLATALPVPSMIPVGGLLLLTALITLGTYHRGQGEMSTDTEFDTTRIPAARKLATNWACSGEGKIFARDSAIETRLGYSVTRKTLPVWGPANVD